MNKSFDFFLHRRHQRQSLIAFVKEIPRVTTGTGIIPRDRLVEILALWQLIQQDVKPTLQFLKSYLKKHHSMGYILFCLATDVADGNNRFIVQDWINTSNKKPAVHVDIPENLLFAIYKFLTPAETVRFQVSHRLSNWAWVFAAWQQQLFQQMLKIESSYDLWFKNWCIHLGAVRLTWMILMDGRLTDDKCLTQLLAKYDIEITNSELLWPNVSRPSVCRKTLIDQSLEIFLSYLNDKTYTLRRIFLGTGQK